MSVKKDALSIRGAGHGTAEEGAVITSDKVLVFGDPHLSAVYSGTHRDYQENCRRVMIQFLDHVRSAQEGGHTVAVIFLGDVFGVKERNIRDHGFLAEVIMFFKQLNLLCQNNVFSVRGNHDFGSGGSYPDFALFEVMGYIRNPLWIDYKPSNEDRQLRFHLVNFGAEDRKLAMAHEEPGSDVSDIILAHNDFKIDGLTAWYGGDSIDLKRQVNFSGADLLIVGHIHTPTEGFLPCTIANGADIQMFYPGCPTRVSERYDDCYYVIFEMDGAGATYTSPKFGLWSAEEEFFPKTELPEEARLEEMAAKERNARLEELVSSMQENQIFGGDLVHQITNYPQFTEESKQVALDYYGKANG